MTYTALPDRRMPWDNDGTVYALGDMYDGVAAYPNGTQAIAANGYAGVSANGQGGSYNLGGIPTGNSDWAAWLFFPEQREVSAYYCWGDPSDGVSNYPRAPYKIEGSNDTTNGLDGTWETASVGGASTNSTAFDWRGVIFSISFTGPKRAIRLRFPFVPGGSGTSRILMNTLHVYGQKAAGQTPDDVIYLDGLHTYAEFTAPEDFGDVPLATTTVRTFKVKNASATHTANTVNIQCNDADFAISTDNVTWVATINIASLAAGASSAVMYVRNTSPSIGSPLGPRHARIVTTVASYT